MDLLGLGNSAKPQAAIRSNLQEEQCETLCLGSLNQ